MTGHCQQGNGPVVSCRIAASPVSPLGFLLLSQEWARGSLFPYMDPMVFLAGEESNSIATALPMDTGSGLEGIEARDYRPLADDVKR